MNKSRTNGHGTPGTPCAHTLIMIQATIHFKHI